MLVDKDNFKEANKLVQNLINKDLKYVGFDLEMTGIKGDFEEFQFDLPFERFGRNRVIANKFKVIQVGLTFINSINEKDYQATPFTFYLFPQEIQGLYNPNISLEIGAIEFLNSNNMDWNRWLKKGITYVPNYLEEKLRQHIFQEENKQNDEEKSDQIYSKLSEEEKIKVDKQIKQLKEFSENQEKQVIIQENNSYMRRFFHKLINEKYSKFTKEQIQDKNQIILLKFTSEEEKIQYLKEVEQHKQNQLENYLGFTKILEFISKSKVPIIGHNCFMDCLFLYDSFIKPLVSDRNNPQQRASFNEYIEWKQEFNKFFSKLYDTKFISNQFFNNVFMGQTTLEQIKDKIIECGDKFKPVNINLNKGYESYDFLDKNQQTKLHEAGFDSYLTAWVFLRMTSQLKEDEIQQSLNIINNMKSYYNIQLALVEEKPRYCSIIYVLRDNPKQKLPFLQDKQLQGQQFKKDKQKQIMQKLKETMINAQNSQYITIRSSFDFNYFVELKLEDKNTDEIQKKFIDEIDSFKKLGFDVKPLDTYSKDRQKYSNEKKF